MSKQPWEIVLNLFIAVVWVAILISVGMAIATWSPANAHELSSPTCHLQISQHDTGADLDHRLPAEVHWLEVETRRARFFFNRWFFTNWEPLGVHLGRVTVLPAVCDGKAIQKGFAVSFPCKCGMAMRMRWRPLDAQRQPFTDGGFDIGWHEDVPAGDDWVCPKEEV